MKRRLQKRSGLTLVELLVGLTAGSIVAVTAGVMLFYGFLAWKRDNAQVQVQRDGTTAMIALGRATRGATNAVLSQPEFDVQGPDGVWKRFYVNANGGNRLYYQPVRGNSSTEIPLTDYPVATFTNGPTDDGVLVQLELAGDEGPVRTTTIIHRRNREL